jgi:hypothetical protein
LAIWGSNLGEKKKATLVEALLWRRYGSQIMTDDAPLQLQSLLKIKLLIKFGLGLISVPRLTYVFWFY